MDSPELQLLEFLKSENAISRYVEINDYILKHFTKPPEGTVWENDPASLLLKYLEEKKYIRIQGNPFPQIGIWEYATGSTIHKRWWDDLTEPTPVKITLDGLEYIKTERDTDILLQTNISTRKTNYVIRVTSILQASMAFLSLLAISVATYYAIAAYNKPDSDNLVQLRKSIQHQQKILEGMQKSQRGMDSSLRKMAAKNH